MSSQQVLKGISSAPGLSKLFLLTSRNIANGLISSFERFALQGERVCCVWLGPKRMVVALHPETVKTVMSNPKVYPKFNERQELHPVTDLNRVEGQIQPELVTSNGEEWKNMRKHFNPAFSVATLEKLVPAFYAESEVFSRKCAENKELEITLATSQYALDCLGVALLGKSFSAQQGEFKEMYDHYTYIMKMFGDPLGILFPSMFKFPFPRTIRLKNSVKVMKTYLENTITEKMEAMEKKEDRTNEEQRPYSILDAIVEASKENEGFPKRTILPNLWTFFIAGHDTTATSLAWLIHELAKSPQIQGKIREEAELALGKMEKAPSLADLESLPYLDAVLKENLRMHPPIHNLFTRGAAEDTSLGGYAVPAGTPVSIAISAVNRHPVSWESPNDFRPERFIEDENRKFKLFSWMPFSVGVMTVKSQP